MSMSWEEETAAVGGTSGGTAWVRPTCVQNLVLTRRSFTKVRQKVRICWIQNNNMNVYNIGIIIQFFYDTCCCVWCGLLNAERENHPQLIKHIIVCYIIVCNEWTELNCSSEAAPEELEEHSMVAHEVQTHYLMLLQSFCYCCTAWCVKNMFHNFDLFRASSMCLEACWILRTPSWDVPSGYLTLVSFTVEV